jgi:RNA-directed DNA polymerase
VWIIQILVIEILYLRFIKIKKNIRFKKLNQYLIGWCGYFVLADTKSIFEKLDGWIRRRLRICLWKFWKKPNTKIRNLVRLGLPDWKAYEWGNGRKGYWRISKSPVLHNSLGNSYWSNESLVRHKYVMSTCVIYLD